MEYVIESSLCTVKCQTFGIISKIIWDFFFFLATNFVKRALQKFGYCVLRSTVYRSLAIIAFLYL